MFKGLGDMASLLRQAQEMQTRVRELQERLGSLRLALGAGAVAVRLLAGREADDRQGDGEETNEHQTALGG